MINIEQLDPPDPPLDTTMLQTTPAVSAAYEQLRSVTHERVTVQPAVKLAELVHDFGKGFVGPELLDVTMLATIGNRLSSDIKVRNARRALSIYQSQVAPEQYKYTTNLLSDLPIIDKFIDSQLAARAKKATGKDPVLRDAFDGSRHAVIEPRLWSLAAGLAPLRDLLTLAEDTNLESILIKACEALLVASDENTPDDVLFRTIHTIESIYAPLCEAVGLDAFAATLLSRAYLIRLEKQGQHAAISYAQSVLSRMGSPGEVAEFTANLPSLFLGESIHEPVVNDSSGHETFFSMALTEIESEHFSGEVKVLLRVKSLGSTARKISRNGEIPADMIGVTVITDSAGDVGTTFAYILDKLEAMREVKFVSAASRDESLHIKGSAEFLAAIKASLRLAGNTKAIDEKKHDGGFEYAKFTIEWHTDDDKIMPIEVQFMHADSRTESRVGYDAHTLFKYFKLSDTTGDNLSLHDAVKSLQEINRRKAYLDHAKLSVNGASIKRGDELRRLIEFQSPLSTIRRGHHVLQLRQY